METVNLKFSLNDFLANFAEDDALVALAAQEVYEAMQGMPVLELVRHHMTIGAILGGLPPATAKVLVGMMCSSKEAVIECVNSITSNQPNHGEKIWQDMTNCDDPEVIMVSPLQRWNEFRERLKNDNNPYLPRVRTVFDNYVMATADCIVRGSFDSIAKILEPFDDLDQETLESDENLQELQKHLTAMLNEQQSL